MNKTRKEKNKKEKKNRTSIHRYISTHYNNVNINKEIQEGEEEKKRRRRRNLKNHVGSHCQLLLLIDSTIRLVVFLSPLSPPLPDGNRFMNSSWMMDTTLRMIWSTSPSDTCFERFWSTFCFSFARMVLLLLFLLMVVVVVFDWIYVFAQKV